MNKATVIDLADPSGFVYLLADPHLGHHKAPGGTFLHHLSQLPQARMLVLMGDLFMVWLAAPKFWDESIRAVIAGLATLREQGTRIVMVAGNRDYLLPRDGEKARSMGLPFDEVVHGAGLLHWGGRRIGITHGDLVNREDHQYLRWRHYSRSAPVSLLFRAMPGFAANALAKRLERSLAGTNREIKIQYPASELAAFAGVVTEAVDSFYIGHFHLDRIILPPQSRTPLRIVPDWLSSKSVLRIDAQGEESLLSFEDGDQEELPL